MQTEKLKDHTQVVLVIIDGWGIREKTADNAIENARKPFFDHLWNNFPHAKLAASGLAVGLPEGEMGNSEVGHLTIGAGKPIDTDIVRINKSIKENSLCDSPEIVKLFKHVKDNHSVLHLMGLVSPGGVHSHQDHLFTLLKIAKDAGIEKVAIHVFTDGRDTPPQAGAKYLEELEQMISRVGIGFIASVSGRYFAMDRDNNWDRTEKVEQALFECIGEACELITPSQMLKKLYQSGVSDEHIEPLIFKGPEGKTYPLSQNDGVLFFNIRSDRARQISKKVLEKTSGMNIQFVTMVQYDKELSCPVVFTPNFAKTSLSDQIADAHLTQAHIAETEKYPHVTYFLNCGREIPREGEEYILVDSRKDIKTHDQAPEMKAIEIAQKTVEQIEKGTQFIALNLANPDMVGHSGNYQPTVKAIEAVDQAIKIIVEAAQRAGAVVFITADHGNAEQMADPETGDKFTAHTKNPVPGILVTNEYKLKSVGGLSDVAPTILDLLGIKKPMEMTGSSLLH